MRQTGKKGSPLVAIKQILPPNRKGGQVFLCVPFATVAKSRDVAASQGVFLDIS